MPQEIQKSSNSELTTAKQLYASNWSLAFAEVMDIIAQRWKLVLYQKRDGQTQPAPLLVMWRDSLKHLSPNQMREGLRLYLCSENGHFEPSPGDIIANAPDRATDRPRKLKNPDCPDCRGTGYRMVEVDSKVRPGKKANAVIDCYCVRIEYEGKTYAAAERQLPAARPDPAAVKRIDERLAAAANGKRFPKAPTPLTDAEYQQRQEELERQKKILEAT